MAELGMFPMRCVIFDTFSSLDCPQPCISSGFSSFQYPFVFHELLALLLLHLFFTAVQRENYSNCYPLTSNVKPHVFPTTPALPLRFLPSPIARE